MSGPPEDADQALWTIIAATIRPLRSRSRPRVQPAPTPPPVPAPPPAVAAGPRADPASAAATRPPPPRAPRPPQEIEPRRRRRLERGREAPTARIDLHGLDQVQARAVLTGFILRAWDENRREVLVITGKGAAGDGILRRRVPEWLADPPLRPVVAGLSWAHRRHGGGGALYVALKRAAPR